MRGISLVERGSRVRKSETNFASRGIRRRETVTSFRHESDDSAGKVLKAMTRSSSSGGIQCHSETGTRHRNRVTALT